MIPPAYVRSATTVERRGARDARLLLLVLESGQAFLLRARAAIERGDFADFVADLGRLRHVLAEVGPLVRGPETAPLAPELARLAALLVGDLGFASAARSLARLDEVLASYGPVLDASRRLVEQARDA